MKRVALLALLAPLLSSCELGYYAHVARGEIDLLRARTPIAEVVADPATDPALRDRLQHVAEARRWAVTALALPDNDSYTLYADLHRPYVVWNVFATAEFSLDPLQNCFLVVGCLAYRGYFDEALAQARAAELQGQGLDVYVAGIPAYSTLGWFADPVTNTMMRWSDELLISTVFHELAHQKVYVKGDTAFDESFAQFVQEEGLREYLQTRGGVSDAEVLRRRRQEQFVRLVLDTRTRLEALYRAGGEPDALRTGKQRELVRLKDDYEILKRDSWGGYAGYDAWFAQGPLNNARLLPFGLYDQWQTAFAALFRDSGSEWNAFYAAVEKLGKLPPGERTRALEALKARALPE
jgi:predicted aminopeptidase